MPNVRFVQGPPDSYSVIYEADWPIVPRVGEHLSMTNVRRQVMDWKVTRICHVGSNDKGFVGSLALIEHANANAGTPQAVEPGTF